MRQMRLDEFEEFREICRYLEYVRIKLRILYSKIPEYVPGEQLTLDRWIQ